MPHFPPTPVHSLEQHLVPIEFLIIGGGVAGLCSAIALTQVGHRVTLLERGNDFEKTKGAAGCRIPPNMSKFLIRWGLEERLKELALTSRTVHLARYESGYTLGTHSWEAEVLKETGGDFICMHYGALRNLLYETAVEHGTVIQCNAEVASIAIEPEERPTVVLVSGEKFEFDVVLGADGQSGISRRVVADQEERETPLGLTMYNLVIPGDRIRPEPELLGLLEQDTIYTWLGDGRAVIGYPMKGPEGQHERDYALHIWLPKDDISGSGWTSFVDSKVLLAEMGASDSRLRKLAGLASAVACVPVTDRTELEDWVHEDGHLLLIGDAAHPFYPGSLQAMSLAVGDAAALGHLFQHLHSHEQIESFLWAFEEIRQNRVKSVREAELNYLSTITLPSGEMQESRDKSMRAKYDAGLNALDVKDGDIIQQFEAVRETFGYDAEDEADDWWVNWGSLKERAEYDVITPEFAIEVQEEESTTMVTVE